MSVFKPSALILQTVGIICTYTTCNHFFPPPEVPPVIVSYSNNSPKTRSLVVNTTCGPVQGYFANSLRGNLFRAFEGVPYAEPPTGEHRFRAPRPKKPWNGILRANRPRSCAQMHSLRLFEVVGQEDCLTLNIYAPAAATAAGNGSAPLPVYFYIHGGAFYWGAGHQHGPTYIMDQELVLVTVNYRLGVLGFLSTWQGEGNWGLKDQALALDWVRDNIAAFGGDPTRITIGGQSSGAASAHLHMLSPISRGKFTGAIVQSGSALSHWALPPNQLQIGETLARSVGCKDSDDLECLRRVPADKLVAAQLGLFEWLQYPSILFGPIIESNHSGAFLTTDPKIAYALGQVARVPMIMGIVKDEGQLLPLVMQAIPLGTHVLLTHASRAVPAILMYNRAQAPGLQNRICEFYLGPTHGLGLGGSQLRRKLGEMVSDRFYYMPLHKTLEAHATSPDPGPLYVYRFSYKGQHGAPDKALKNAKDWGVMHGDELQFLFNSTEFFAPLYLNGQNGPAAEADVQMSEYLIGLWSSFIKTGKPDTARTGKGQWTAFGQNGEQQVLEIDGLEPKMRAKEHIFGEKRVAFWKSIGLY